jgi:hypothetical protein
VTSPDLLLSPAGEAPRRWSRPRFLPRLSRAARGALALALVVVLAGAWQVDRQRRGSEFSTLLSAARQGQSTVDDSDRKVASMIEYVSPLLHAERTPPDVRAGLQQIVRQAAVQAAAALRAQAAQFAAIRVWGWHDEAKAARDAYVRDLRARAVYYDQFMTPVVSKTEFAQESTIESEWFAARAAFLTAATTGAERREVEQVLSH